MILLIIIILYSRRFKKKRYLFHLQKGAGPRLFSGFKRGCRSFCCGSLSHYVSWLSCCFPLPAVQDDHQAQTQHAEQKHQVCLVSRLCVGHIGCIGYRTAAALLHDRRSGRLSASGPVVGVTVERLFRTSVTVVDTSRVSSFIWELRMVVYQLYPSTSFCFRVYTSSSLSPLFRALPEAPASGSSPD